MIKSNITIEVEIADNGAIIRQIQSDGSPIVEVVEGEDCKVIYRAAERTMQQ